MEVFYKLLIVFTSLVVFLTFLFEWFSNIGVFVKYWRMRKCIKLRHPLFMFSFYLLLTKLGGGVVEEETSQWRSGGVKIFFQFK